jgi:DHA1 family inner membrane transport protein
LKAAFVTGSPLQLMVMEKASAAPSLASSANQAAFNLANAGGAWIGGLTLAAGLGVTSPALAGSALAVLGLLVAGTAYAVDRRTPRPGRERVVATHVPTTPERAHHG